MFINIFRLLTFVMHGIFIIVAWRLVDHSTIQRYTHYWWMRGERLELRRLSRVINRGCRLMCCACLMLYFQRCHHFFIGILSIIPSWIKLPNQMTRSTGLPEHMPWADRILPDTDLWINVQLFLCHTASIVIEEAILTCQDKHDGAHCWGHGLTCDFKN